MEETGIDIDELCQVLRLERAFIEELEREGLICLRIKRGDVRFCTEKEAQRIRVICNLVHDLGVNLPGVEVILHMRERMIEMQRQFDQILDHLADEIKKEIEKMMPTN